jgi:putative ABC transport system permease protein
MRSLAAFRLRLRTLVRRDRVEQDLDDELRYHLDRLIETHLAAGRSPAAARRLALAEMGAIELHKEECRDARGFALVDSLRRDLGYATRALRKSPGFTAVAILSLALGIGATTTIFTFVNAVLLRPLPYPGADRLVLVQERPLDSPTPVSVHPVNYIEWRTRARAFEALTLVQTPPLNIMGAQGAEQVGRLMATAELFPVFGVRPALGRGLAPEDARPGGENVVVLGHGFWQRWFGGDPGVLGRQLRLPDGSLTIVGVAPPGFRVGTMEPEVITPLPIDPARPAAIGSRAFQCYGRLARGVDLHAAQAELDVLMAALRQREPIDAGMGAVAAGLHDYLVAEARPSLRLLMGVVAAVLAIACVNLAGLLLARGVGRRAELAVRAALGASRGRLTRQLVIESLVLAVAGGAAGLAIAWLATQGLTRLAAATLTAGTIDHVRLDGAVLLFSVGISCMTVLAFGLLPALHAGRIDPQSALREQGRSATANQRHHHVRRALVLAEVALAMMLLAGAGTLLRTLNRLARTELGFQPAGTVAMNLFLGTRPPEARSLAIDRILDEVERVPGVRAAGTIQFLPLRGTICGTGFWFEADAGSRDPARAHTTDCLLISRGYVEAMGVPVVAGRAFARSDRRDSPRVLIVNRAFARRYFPDGRAVGRRIFVQSSGQALAEIVGVVGHTDLAVEPGPAVFLLHAQTPGYITNLVVRTDGDPLAHAAAIRRAIHAADPSQAVSAVATIEQDVAAVLARPRLQATVVTTFASIAVLIAVIGVYGLLAFVVSERRHEIGIRMALGATRGAIFAELLSQGIRPVLGGLAVGAGAAAALRQAAAALGRGLSLAEPSTIGLAALGFFAVALVAVALPVHRATRIDPLGTLRSS